jgi:murein DD-endopeptidase MepM/ murein hydrolase activator NlpD
MPSQNKTYTFLLTLRRKGGLSIRRVTIEKSHLRGIAASMMLFCALVSVSMSGASGVEMAAVESAPTASFLPADAVAETALTGEIPATAPQTVTEPLSVETPRNAAAEMLASAPTVERAERVAPQPRFVRPTAESAPLSVKTGGPSFRNAREEPLDDLPASGVGARVRQLLSLGDQDFLPLEWALRGKINNEFGFRRNPFGGRSYEFHGGMDIDGDYGDPVYAPGKGVVIRAGWMGGYGNLVEIDHGYGVTTRYGHLSKIEVRVGEEIARGELLGLVGSTGRSTGPHLHYEIRLNDKAVNPRLFLSGRSVVKE